MTSACSCITPSASSLEVIANKDNAYQVCFTDPAQGSAPAEYIFNKKVGEKVAIIYNNADTYSTGIYQTFESKAAELGLNIVSVTTFTNDTTDFSVQVTEAKNAGADVVFLPIYYTPASQILNAANTMGYKPVFFGVDGMDGILTMPGFDVALAEDVMLLTPFSADAPDELTRASSASIRKSTARCRTSSRRMRMTASTRWPRPLKRRREGRRRPRKISATR